MDQKALQDLIEEVHERDGGLILQMNNKPEAIVLSVDHYNELLNKTIPMQPQQVSPKPVVNVRHTSQKVLVTGGAGYIGSHAVRQLLKAGYEVVILDNLSSGKVENLAEGAKFVEGDLKNVNLLRDLFVSEQFDAVMHFAASIEVEESVQFPQKYLDNNVLNTANLLEVMIEAGVKKIIFSSTAAVYGEQSVMPISETAKVSPNNPYGYSKLLAERLIKYYAHFSGLQAVVFRYFNACGCDFDGTILPTHQSHLIPVVLEVALGRQPFIRVNGTDYATVDGTCMRDYVHVLDIARAHVLALEQLGNVENYRIYNIGTGHGSSVMEVVNHAAEVLNKIIPMEVGGRRAGDAPATVADNSKIKNELGFSPEYSDLDTIIQTTWTQMQNTRK